MSTAPPRQPLWFEASGLPLLGWYHPPNGAFCRCGVVICNPIGWEAIAAHRALRLLAEQLAGVGFAVLRYDHPGQGDSSLCDEDSGLVQAWRAAVVVALDKLVELSGALELAVVGVRFGATLGLYGASDHRKTSSFAALALCPGNTWGREVRAFRGLSSVEGSTSSLSEGDEESSGFLFGRETLAAARELSLRPLPTPVPRNILLLGREGVAADSALAERLRAAGASVREQTMPGYTALMQEPRKSKPPVAAWDALVAWLSLCHPARPIAAPRTSAVPPQSAQVVPGRGAPPVKETAMSFGVGGHLFGLLAEPQGAATKSIALLLTVASHHRVGPNRMHVRWARSLAQRGIASFRFDLTGVGDSPTYAGRAENALYAAEFVADVQAAMDLLQRERGWDEFAAVGLCSGAHLAFHATNRDPRISSQLLINPQTLYYREGDTTEVTRRQTLRSNDFYKHAMLSPRTWLRILRGEIQVGPIGRALLGRLSRKAVLSLNAGVTFLRSGRAETEVGRDLRLASARGVRTLAIFCSGDEGLDYLAAHLGRNALRAGRVPGLTTRLVDGPDHTFTQLWAQRWLSDQVLEFLGG